MPKVIDQTSDETKALEWARDDADTKVFTITSSGVALNISGYTFVLTVDSKKDPTDALSKQFSVIGAFVTDGSDGKIGFTPAEGDTQITPGKYFYDIQWKLGTAQRKTLIKGLCYIIQDITKDA